MDKYINIFDFSAYRDYLNAWIEEARRQKKFNLSRMATVAGVHSTFLSHALGGKKDLSLEQAALVSQHLEHTQIEKDYFFVLIQLDKAGNQNLKEYWQQKKKLIITEKNKLSQRFEKHHELTEQQRVIFYSSWLYVAAWGATSIDDGQTLDQIAERFRISRDKAEEVMNFLTQCGVCDIKKNIYTIGKAHVHINNESPLVVKHHNNWRNKALQKMDFRELDELFFTSPMTMSKKAYEQIRENLNIFVKESVNIATSSKTAEEVVCLNIDFFKPTR